MYHSLSADDTLEKLSTSSKHGLTSKEAEKRLIKFGENKLSEKKRKKLVSRFFEQMKDFMIIVLLAAAAFSLVVSYLKHETDYVDPIIILAIIILNSIMGMLQESKAEKALASLKTLAAPSARCLRDGTINITPASSLVAGDIICLEAGQYVPADARIIASVSLAADESALTGESLPTSKDGSLTLPEPSPLAERSNMAFSGTFITEGHGTAVITATGMESEVGKIAKLLQEDSVPETPLQKRLAKTGKYLGIASLIICAIIFIIGTLQGRPPFDMFMTSVSLAVAAIPEGLPIIVTIMLSQGVWRMAKQKAVLRSLPAVEALGSATFICSDKTGTLTQNRMTVVKIAPSAVILNAFTEADYYSDAFADKSGVSSGSAVLLQNALLCSNNAGNPTEKAILSISEKAGLNREALEKDFPRLYELPFDSSRKRMTVLLHPKSGYRSITKGAFDVLLPLCTHALDGSRLIELDRKRREKIKAANDYLAGKALRIIAVAYRDFKSKPENKAALLENKLVFQGLIGIIDPPRPEVAAAVATCREAGITPVMITGDHVLTARAIADQAGILPLGSSGFITGDELDAMPEEILMENVQDYRVYARVSPLHKVRIVKCLQSYGEVVAMTGDGINDAPALRAADIGCAMGLGGTDVAKGASDMILLDDNFATIISAVKEGRNIYSNIRKAIHFLLSCNTGEILTIFIAILLGMPAPLLPVQLLFVNLITDSLPAIALGVEPASPNAMKEPPLPSGKSLFSGGLFSSILIEGCMIGGLALLAYILGNNTTSFAVLGISQLFHAFSLRSDESLFTVGFFSNKRMVIAFLIGIFLQISIIAVPSLSAVFRTVPLSAPQWLMVFVLSFMPVLLMELSKKIRN